MRNLPRIPTVYLGGGLKGSWQAEVMHLRPEFIYFDPRSHRLTNELQYTAWDISALDRSDFLVGFMSEHNPGGSGLALEIGWAAKAGIPIFLVEMPGYAQQRYFGMARALADQVVQVADESHAVSEICDWLGHKISKMN